MTIVTWTSKLIPKEKMTIVIVDDDEAVSQAMGRLVRSHGMRAEVFTSSEDFMSKVYAKSGLAADCLILDEQMPGLTGLQVQAALRQLNIHLPVVFITAHEDPAIREKAMAAGAAAFLHKPFRDKELVRALGKAINFPQQRE